MTSRPSLPIFSIGIDHHGADLAVRERFAFSEQEAEDTCVRLLAEPSIRELYLLSTCNRTELYVRPAEGREEAAFTAAFNLAFRDRAPELSEHGGFSTVRGNEAARHLLAVACGLRSMVLGEPEILGQVRRAGEQAERWGTSGPVLRRLVRQAIGAGGRARTETGIGAGAVSLGYATAELARQIFKRPADARVLLVGAGETALLVGRALYERGFTGMTVANRSRGRLERFIEEIPDAEPARLERIPELLVDAALLVTAVATEEPLVVADTVRTAIDGRGRSLLIVDLGVPRNVDAAAGELDNVFLHDLEALNSLVQRNLKQRRAEVPKVEELVDNELVRFLAWYRSLAAEPLVSRLQKRAEHLRAQLVNEARGEFPRETHEALDQLTKTLTRRLLHHPSRRLRTGEAEDEIADLDLVRELFRLDDD